MTEYQLSASVFYLFCLCRDGATASWVINQYFRGVKCLAQGHNTAAVGFEPPASRSGELSASQNNITYYSARQSRAEPQTKLAFPRSRFN